MRTESPVARILPEDAEAKMKADSQAARLIKKGVELGDVLLDMARLLVSRGVFSKERHLSEILIYSAAIADGCEVCALTHIDSAIRAKAPEAVINTVQAIALYVHAQADDDTYLLVDAYTKHWQRFADWPHLPDGKVSNLKFYNLVPLLMSLVVCKQMLVRLHTRELLIRSDVTPEELLKVIGIAQVMGGFPTRWEAVHIHKVANELREQGLLPAFSSLCWNGFRRRSPETHTAIMRATLAPHAYAAPAERAHRMNHAAL